MTILKIAASLLLVVGAVGAIGIFVGGGNLGPQAFADDIPGIDNVRGMTWTKIFFARVTSADKKRTWIRQTRIEYAYRHPGQYRKTVFGDDGKPESIVITDLQARRMLSLNPKEKTAFLQFPERTMDERGPFAWVGDEIRAGTLNGRTAVVSVSLAGQRKVDNIDTNVVRVKSAFRGQKHTVDYLFDQKTKQLVYFASGNPGSNFHPDTSIEEMENPAEKQSSRTEAIGHRTHKIVVNTKIDPAEFSLDAPAGYQLKTLAEPTVTEADMLAFLGAAARFNDNTFPDSALEPYDRDRFNEESRKKRGDRLATAQALFDIRDKIARRGIYQSPVLRFMEDQTKQDSFHYVGADVKVGEGNKIVGWYLHRNGKTYRALYGDLSVKDVTKADLPLVLAD